MAEPQKDPNKQQQGGLGGLFHGHKGPAIDPEEIRGLHHDMNSLSRRVRELEERSQNLRRKVQMTDNNLMSQNKKFRQELKTVNTDLNDMKNKMNDLDNKMLLLIKELRLCARNEEVKVLERYVNMWEPIRFVTRKEVERIVEDKVNDSLARNNH
mgnify:CR=1 FL=1